MKDHYKRAVRQKQHKKEGSVLRFDHIEGLFKLGGIRQQTLQDGGIACDLDLTRLLTGHQSKQLQPPTGNGRLRIRAVLARIGQ